MRSRMNRDLARQYLDARINRPLLPNLYNSFNGSIRLQVDHEAIDFDIRHSIFSWLPQQVSTPVARQNADAGHVDVRDVDATFHFASWADMVALLCGQANLMEAFMQQRVRADGYLLWTFTLLALFRGEASATPPVPPT